MVVEGYTDVMACHLAGVETAVATCGTAFGVEHIKILRRIMRDEADLAPARVIFTFDGDAAGQKAAMRAFAEDQRWASQSFVAVEPAGMDPCELRTPRGSRRCGRSSRTPCRCSSSPCARRSSASTSTPPRAASGRSGRWRPSSPRSGTEHAAGVHPEVSGWLGIEVEQVAAEVRKAGRVRHDDTHDPTPSAGQHRRGAGARTR